MPNNIKVMLEQNYKKTAIFKLYETSILNSNGGIEYIDFKIPKPNFKYSKAYFKFCFYADDESLYGKIRVILNNDILENQAGTDYAFPAVVTNGGTVRFRIEQIQDTKITVMYRANSVKNDAKIWLEEVIFIE